MAALLAAAALTAAPSGAQQGASSEWSGVSASPLLPPDHWAVRAARRAEALGLTEGFLPAQQALPRHVVGAVLSAASAAAGDEPWAGVARGWDARFREEFGLPAEPGLQRSSVHAALRHDAGRAAPGTGDHHEVDRTGATPLPDRTAGEVVVDLAAALGPRLAVEAAPRLGSGGFEFERLELVAGLEPVSFSVGRQPVGFGQGRGGGVILSGAAALDRVQVETVRPFRLPSVLRLLGPVSLHTFLGRITDDRHQRRPYTWGARGSVQPHPRFTLGVQRASMFGGEGEGNEVTGRRVLEMLLGRVNAGDRREYGFANQEVSVEALVRLPTERVVPLSAYMEWGFEDAAGAWKNVPGRVVGLYAPALPGAPQAALGVEWASFAGNCCANPAWYRHYAFPGSWALDDRPLGHALGGHGTELMLYSQLDLLDSRIRVDGRSFRRDRGADNLFVPGREGVSRGVAGAASWRWSPRSDLRLDAGWEAGEGWTERSVELGVSLFF